jgi:hypothetical protein
MGGRFHPMQLLGGILLGQALLLGGTLPVAAQGPVIPPEHQWTDIGKSGHTAVDWTTLERQDINAGGPIFLVWVHTEERGGSVVVHAAIRCRPRHAAVIEARRTRADGTLETAGPVPLTELAWQDPAPRDYLTDVESAVCARMRSAQVRPC